MRLVVATKSCCSDKDFHKNSPVHPERVVAGSNVLQRHVAATCCLVCTDLYLSQVDSPLLKLILGAGKFAMGFYQEINFLGLL